MFIMVWRIQLGPSLTNNEKYYFNNHLSDFSILSQTTEVEHNTFVLADTHDEGSLRGPRTEWLFGG